MLCLVAGPGVISQSAIKSRLIMQPREVSLQGCEILPSNLASYNLVARGLVAFFSPISQNDTMVTCFSDICYIIIDLPHFPRHFRAYSIDPRN